MSKSLQVIAVITLSLSIILIILADYPLLDNFCRLIKHRIPTSFLDLSPLGGEVPWSIIKHTYIINPAKFTDRWANVKKQLINRNISFTRVEAVDSTVVDNIIQKAFPLAANLSSILGSRFKADGRCYLPNIDKNICQQESVPNGGHACTLSHMKVWLQVIDNFKLHPRTDGPVMIFEDDVLLAKDFVSITTRLINFLEFYDKNWVMLGLGYSANHASRTAVPYILDRNNGFGSLHAYVLKNAASAQILFDYYNQPFVPCSDHYFWEIFEKNDALSSYVYVPNDIAIQINMYDNSYVKSNFKAPYT